MPSTEPTAGDAAEAAGRALLERAIGIALRAHAGHVDRQGVAYILHPLRVMLRLQGYEAMAAGVLHDVVEDSAVTLDDLRAEGFPEGVVAAVDAMTRRPGETYEEYIERVAAHPLGRRIKRADLEDHLEPVDSLANDPDHVARRQRYARALQRLEAIADP